MGIKQFRPGLKVKKTMGVRQEGTIVYYVPKDQYTDGQYREPMAKETPVYVLWDNGTKGWLNSCFLQVIPSK